MAPEVLQSLTGGLVGGHGGGPESQRLLGLPEQEMGAMAEVRRALALQTSKGTLAAHAPRHQLAHREMDAGEHELGQGGLARVSHRVEEPQRVLTELAGLEVAALLMEDEAATNIVLARAKS